MKAPKVTKSTKPVIIYDGECNFCLSGIGRIQDKDQANQFLYTPRQTPDLHTHYPQLVALESKAGMRFLHPNGKVYCGADAVYQIYRRIGKYRYITWIYLVPVVRTLLKGAYLIISKNRSRFGRVKCESKNCSVEK
jgi:predicted DCC family thiol-disulfide oxidoreductase YuxK